MRSRFLLSAQAAQDISNIWEYIADDNPEAASRVRRTLLDACRTIGRNPEIGHTREDLTKLPVKFWPVQSYLIVYDPRSRPVAIARVLHGSQNIKQRLRLIAPTMQSGFQAVVDEWSNVSTPRNLNQIIARTNARGFSMASEPQTGALLRALAASKPGGRFLELGTGTGIATAWMLDGMDASSTLTSVDIDSAVQSVAREFLGQDRRLRLILEDGLQFLRHEPAESYDFVFADAMAGKYEGWQDCLRVVKPGGF